jgi:SRSO17 transposase
VLIVDETGFLKKGTKSVGVQRQYSGTAGRIENCQIGVFLALSTRNGHALIDRALYLPESWCDDRARCDEAGVPDDAAFKTKPQLAMEMLGRALDAGIAPDFVLADEVYGNDGKLRRFLEARGQAFVVAVAGNQRLWVGLEQRRVDQIAADAPADSWFRFSVAEGSKGPRVYDWNAARFGAPTDEHGQQRWLLVRRHVETGEFAYYLCCAKPEATPKDLARAAGRRWAIEVCFECAKQQAGLDEYEVRSWDCWHRHVTLSLLAAALLTAVRIAASEVARRSTRRSKNRGR